jgi:lambda family phage tail tape measure protein
MQDMAVALDKRLQVIRHPSSAKEDVASAWTTKPKPSKPYTGPTAAELEAQMKEALASKMREAEIQQQIANLDIAEKERGISHVDAAQKRVELAEQLLKTQQANLSLIDKDAVGGAQAWTAQQKAIDETKKKISDFRLALRDLSNDFKGGFKEGLEQYLDSIGSTFQKAVTLAQATAQAMESAFSDFFFDLMTGKLKKLSDYVMNFLMLIARAVSNFMAQQMVGNIMLGLGLGGGASGGGGGGGGYATVPALHSGGYIMHSGGYVPRFHVGGLSSEEVPAILQKGEYVVSRKGVAALDKINNGEAGGGNINFTMNVDNQTGQPVEAKNTGVKFDGEQYIVSVVLKNISQGGALHHALGAT